jgi:hypothetical protein
MVPQPLPALLQTEVAYHAIMSAAHPREPRISEPTHGASMHWRMTVSNLDASRIEDDHKNARSDEIRRIGSRGAETFCV